MGVSASEAKEVEELYLDYIHAVAGHNLRQIDLLGETFEKALALLGIKHPGAAYEESLDVESSASRQHYIDTGRYLRYGEEA